MNILVTGGKGFIGSHLVDRLTSEGHEVDIIDLKIDKNINIPRDYPDKKYDIIYHLAANADVRGGVENRSIDLSYNIIGTHSVLEFMVSNGCKKLVFTSSATIYGERVDIPTKEDAPNLEPISMYGASKLACEKLISAYSHCFDIKSYIFRLGNIIGPSNTHGVIKDFVKKLKENPKELEVLGDGNQTKQFLDVEDCIDAFCNLPHSDSNFNIYNLAASDTVKIKNLARYISEIVTDDETKLIFTGGDRGWKGDVPITILDNRKLLETRWKPNYTTQEAVNRTVEYLMKNDNI